MPNAPKKVAETYARLRKEYPFYVSLKKINGKYYLYRQSTYTDRKTKKVRATAEYLGRINEDGVFIKKASSVDQELENAKAIILAHGGKVTLASDVATEPQLVKSQPSTEIEKKMLTTLSMNARASLAFLGRQIGLTPSATYNRVKQLENKYGIRYIAEINAEKLGYLPFLIMVKFTDKIPSMEALGSALKKEPRVQLAFLAKGEYDLIIYALAKNVNSEEAIDTVVSLRIGTLKDYPAKWYATHFFQHSFGYIPLREEFIDSLKDTLLKREYAVLRELNKNGAMDFTEIDKKYGFDTGRSQYTYYKLKESNVIRRITISMQKVQIRYIGVIKKEIIDENKFRKSRAHSLLDIVEGSDSPVTKYILTGDISNPDGSILLMPVFKEGDMERNIENLNKFNLGLGIKTWIITSVLIGEFCFRRFDMAYASQYKPLEEQYGIKRPERINYEVSGRKQRAEKKRKEYIIGEEPEEENLLEDD